MKYKVLHIDEITAEGCVMILRHRRTSFDEAQRHPWIFKIKGQGVLL